ADLAIGAQVPDANGIITPHREQRLAVAGKGEVEDPATVAVLGEEVLAVGHVPEANAGILAAGRQRLAVRRQGNGDAAVLMAFVAGQLLARRGVPAADHAVDAYRGDYLFAVRREGDGRGRGVVFGEEVLRRRPGEGMRQTAQLLAAGHVPQA